MSRAVFPVGQADKMICVWGDLQQSSPFAALCKTISERKPVFINSQKQAVQTMRTAIAVVTLFLAFANGFLFDRRDADEIEQIAQKGKKKRKFIYFICLFIYFHFLIYFFF